MVQLRGSVILRESADVDLAKEKCSVKNPADPDCEKDTQYTLIYVF